MIKYSKENIKEVKDALLNNKIVAFPTDTVFGLACLYGDEIAFQKIYEAKNRSINKKLPIMVSDYNMLIKYCVVNKKTKKLIDKFMPGPITLILKYINSDDTVAVRMPNDKWIIELIKEIDKPLYVTSANISGKGSLIKSDDVLKQLGDKVDAIVMADASGNQASTIVDCVNNFEILRDGPISKTQIMDVLE